MVGCPRGAGKQLAVQGVLYVVTAVTENALSLQMRAEFCHGAHDESITMALDDACAQLRLAHAQCYYTCQGRTVRDRHIVLLETTPSTSACVL